ncbi:MAG TPA: hypothetical protein PLA69_00615, partial [Flavobacterium sp.]|nr:hypothetical protein [Flavobacterium sp.]
ALIDSIRMKWLAAHLGLEQLVLKESKMIGYFIADQQSDFYQTQRFTRVLEFVQKHPDLARIKEKQSPAGLRLMLTFENVRSIRRALELLKMIP